ncbi:DUF4405 domain-containing protein [Leisingera sp. McT4-56]|uniref:DUF4405 domain-containing protein n=1 Tax=Leisingera sp. McT4-56 TaxID=2881255 RepID=UPI001CF8E6A8|nr:DUF4405 domain-containing protein [Leisingera sp. McT4-56]MCB4458388.1 DUF4405 domain-containing protein [Leisingera sp. McT4-56]
MADTAPRPRTKRGLTTRALAVFGVTFSFAAILLSGSILFLAPMGRAAQAADWDVLGLARQGWSDLHIVLAALFIGFSLWHAALHFHVFKTLIFGSSMSPRGHRAEALIALAAVAAVTALALLQLPPASWLLGLNEMFKHAFWTP